jgi:hypothetical protein
MSLSQDAAPDASPEIRMQYAPSIEEPVRDRDAICSNPTEVGREAIQLANPAPDAVGVPEKPGFHCVARITVVRSLIRNTTLVLRVGQEQF